MEHESNPAQVRLPRYRELPPLELYKDQVVELVNSILSPLLPGGEVLTDTMVNNYVKLKVIPPPKRKRYAREQLAQLLEVCLLKRVLSIAQLRQLLEQQRGGEGVACGYDALCSDLEAQLGQVWNPVPRQAPVVHAVGALVHKLAFEFLSSE